MSEEKQTAKPTEADLLDDILKEVASWDTGTDEEATPSAAQAVQEEAAPSAVQAEQEEAAPSAVQAEQEEAAPPPSVATVTVLPLPPQENLEEPPSTDEPPPDNLIPFQVPKPPEEPNAAAVTTKKKARKAPEKPEPETVREVAQLAAAETKAWLLSKKKQFDPALRKRRAEIRARDKARAQKAEGGTRKPPRRSLARPLPLPPDTPIKELMARYGKGLSGLRLRCFGLAVCALLLLLLLLLEQASSLPLPAVFRDKNLLPWMALGVFVPALLLAFPIIKEGLRSLFLGRMELTSFVPLSILALLADVLTLQLLQLRPYSTPLFLPICLLLFCQQLGLYFKRSALYRTARTATAAAAPDLMTAEPSQWNGKPVYRRRFGGVTGFSSQLQEEDGAQQRFRGAAPFLFLAALLLPCVPLLIKQQAGLIPWALSATFCAAATLSGTLCFSLPYRGLCRRLTSLGVALAGWSGITTAKAGTGLLVEDTDLFPPGAIEIISQRAFGSFPIAQVISVTASLLRATRSGLDPVFYTLLRTEGGALVTATQVELQSEGISAHVAGDAVLVGSHAFLLRQGIDVPVGVRVKTGVFCAIAGQFAGQFILEYKLHKGAASAMEVLLGSRITPVLIGLDFNLVPSVLAQLFRFPWEKMAFPDISQRAKLRAAPPPRETQLMALLSLYGLGCVAEAAVGAQRLYLAVRISSVLAILGAFVGVLITALLAVAVATSSLNPLGLSLYLLSWLLPTALVSGWVNQF